MTTERWILAGYVVLVLVVASPFVLALLVELWRVLREIWASR